MKENAVFALKLLGMMALGALMAFVAMAPRIWACRESLKEMRAKKELFDQLREDDKKFREELNKSLRSAMEK